MLTDEQSHVYLSNTLSRRTYLFICNTLYFKFNSFYGFQQVFCNYYTVYREQKVQKISKRGKINRKST